MTILLFLKTLLLGLIEGITEFLPISSTGHMILADEFIRLSENQAFTAAFEVFIQSGAILAVVVLFRRELWPFAGTKAEQQNKWLLWAKILVAFIPAAIAGLLFHGFIQEYLFNPVTVAATLIFYGIVLILFERRHRAKPNALHSINDLTFRTAFFIGTIQCLALIPGTSRSTATILGGLVLGLNRTLAAEFSFFLAIPTIAAASLFQLLESEIAFSTTEYLMLGLGFAVSFVVAAIVIKWLMRYLRKHSLIPFGWYRIVLGVIVLGWWFTK
ncbi:MAG: undecaprenyl-diphosphate phosphatase [Verrucomicrobia bacterium]|nr:undecaprenyl-diphosphate phosphatase [Verrucomicrobiota bacterium]